MQMPEEAALRPRLEVPSREKLLFQDLEVDHHVRLESSFGDWKGATILCACGNLVHLDQATVHRRRLMGKPMECLRCRNRRVALEREDLDNEFYDREGD